MESEFQIVAGADERPLVVLRGVIDGWNAPGRRRRSGAPPPGWRRRQHRRGRAGVHRRLRNARAGGGSAGPAARGRSPLAAPLLRAAAPPAAAERVPGPVPTRTRWRSRRRRGRAGSIRIVWKEERFRTPAWSATSPRSATASSASTRPSASAASRSTASTLPPARRPLTPSGTAAGTTPTWRSRCAAPPRTSRAWWRSAISTPGFDPADVPAPEPEGLRPGGMGILIMRSTMDEVTFDFGHGGTRRAPGQAPPPGRMARAYTALTEANTSAEQNLWLMSNHRTLPGSRPLPSAATRAGDRHRSSPGWSSRRVQSRQRAAALQLSRLLRTKEPRASRSRAPRGG